MIIMMMRITVIDDDGDLYIIGAVCDLRSLPVRPVPGTVYPPDYSPRVSRRKASQGLACDDVFQVVAAHSVRNFHILILMMMMIER